jgi:hypothetical protein
LRRPGCHDLVERLVALECGIELERFRRGRAVVHAAEQLRFEREQIGVLDRVAGEDAAKIIVDRAIVVDDQDPPVRLDQQTNGARYRHRG